MCRDWLSMRRPWRFLSIVLLMSCAVSRLGAAQTIDFEVSSEPPPAAHAQANNTPEGGASVGALSSRVKPGETVSVRTMSGEVVVGMFSRASEVSLTVVVDRASREIPGSTVRQVVRQRGANRLKRGLLIGAPLGALVGSGPCYRVDSPPDSPGSGNGASCGASVLAGAALGAGIGAFIGSRFWRPTIVYSAPGDSSPAPTRATAETPALVEAPRPVDERALVTSLGELSSRVTPFDTVYVRTRSGADIAGRFSNASEALLVVEVDGQAQTIPASDVQQVRRRGGNRAKQGALSGFIAGASVGITVLTTSDSESDYSTGEKVFLGAVAGGGTGAIWGAIIGAFVHQRPVVYQKGRPTVLVLPLLSPRATGVMASVPF